MKKAILLVTLITVVNVCSARNPVSILAINSSIIYLKIDKNMIGASLEVEDENGNNLVIEKIMHRKVIVDFYFKKPGKYRIKIKMGDIEQVFTYENVDFQSTKHNSETDVILINQ
jgi:hypothetical protein